MNQAVKLADRHLESVVQGRLDFWGFASPVVRMGLENKLKILYVLTAITALVAIQPLPSINLMVCWGRGCVC